MPTLNKMGILVNFKINQDFIAEVLCINKDEPITVCNGTCYLSQELKKAYESEEHEAPLIKSERIEMIYLYSERTFEVLLSSDQVVNSPNTVYVNKLFPLTFATGIFHPPKLI